MNRPTIRAVVVLLTFATGIGATLLSRSISVPAAKSRVVSTLSDEQQQAAQVIRLPTLSAPAGQQQPTTRFDFDTQVGVAEFTATNNLCLTMMKKDVATGSKVLLATPETNVMVKAVVRGKLPQNCSRNPDIPPGASFYELELEQKAVSTKADERVKPILIGLVGVENIERLKDGGVARLDLDRDGRREYFRDCTSQEGVHLAIWSGQPLKGRKLWVWYYYLGYDVVPTCTKKDYAPEKD